MAFLYQNLEKYNKKLKKIKSLYIQNGIKEVII